MKIFFIVAVVILMSFCLVSSDHAAAPEEQLIEAVKVAPIGAGSKRCRESNGRRWRSN